MYHFSQMDIFSYSFLASFDNNNKNNFYYSSLLLFSEGLDIKINTAKVNILWCQSMLASPL